MKHERVKCECGKEISKDNGARSIHLRGLQHVTWSLEHPVVIGVDLAQGADAMVIARKEEDGAVRILDASVQQRPFVPEDDGSLLAGDHVERNGREYVVVSMSRAGAMVLYNPQYGFPFESSDTAWLKLPHRVIMRYGSAAAAMDAVDRANGFEDRIRDRADKRAGFKRFIESPAGAEARLRALERRRAMAKRKAGIDSPTEAVVE